MTTTTTYPPLTIAQLEADGWNADGSIADGDGLAMAAIGFTREQFDSLPDDHPGVLAWELLVSEAIAEITPQVGELLYQALERRLPWSWTEGDRA